MYKKGALLMNDFEQKALGWDDDPSKVKRAKIIADEIKKNIMLSQNMVAFEYGCGTGLVSFNLQPLLKNIVLGDSSEGMLNALKQKNSSKRYN